MTNEADHLAQLRAALEAMERPTEAARDEAIRTLLRVAIGHHQPATLGVPDEEVPPFMETGEPIPVPPSGAALSG